MTYNWHTIDKPVKFIKDVRRVGREPLIKGRIEMEKPTIQEIEKALGLNKIEPVFVSPGIRKDIDEKGDAFRELYERELLRIYDEL